MDVKKLEEQARLADSSARAAMQVVVMIGSAIQELGEVPSGHLYAAVMHVIDLDGYQKVIAILKRAGLVTESGHVLRWIGPKRDDAPKTFEDGRIR